MELAKDLDYNLISFIDSIGFVQGLTLGLLLIILHKKKYKSSIFLGIFLIVYSLRLVFYILQDLDASAIYPGLYLLPFNFAWLIFPLFFIYTQQVSIFGNRKRRYWTLLPGVLSFIAQCIIYFQPYETKVLIEQSFWHELVFTIIGMFYSWGIAIWNLRLLHRHKIEAQNHFSLMESKELVWAKIFLLFFLVVSLLNMVLYYFFAPNVYSKAAYTLLDLAIIYWVSYHGVEQRNVLSILVRKGLYQVSDNATDDTHDLPIVLEDGTSPLMNQIDNYMIENEKFLSKDLTIVELAKSLDIHPKRISSSINTVCKQNFNNYVNQFRIRKAEKLLEDDNQNHNFSIEGIALEVGFHSKSAFYSAFKKFTGTTPTKYKENVMA